MAASPLPLDKDLTEHRIQDLANPDAIAALFAELGYRTENRIEQTPANLGINSEELRRDIRSIELLAEQEDGFQVYLFVLRTVKVAHRQILARAFRDRAGFFLCVLTSDFERIDFVFLESYLPIAQEEILPGIPQKLFRHKLRPLAHTVQRRSPSAPDLRLLRRFTWTEGDSFAQQEKIVHAYGVVYWSEQFFNNRALFSDYYLLHRFKERPEWDEDPKPIFRELRQLYRDAAARAAAREIHDRKSLLSGFLAPVLSALGFAFEPGTRGSGRPRLQGEPENLSLYMPGGDTLLARCLLFPWGRALDRKDNEQRDKEQPDVNPSVLVVSLLETGDVPWVILTNGRLWRLYARRAHSRATNYYEIDLGEVLDATGPFAADPNEFFRYFWLLFRRKSFESQAFDRDGQTIQETLLDHLRAESEAFARKLGDNLKNQIFEEVFPSLAAGFASDLRRNTAAEELSQEDLDLVFRGTLTFLYRLLFLLYAEARDLLPVREVRGYYDASLKKLKEEIADVAGQAVVETRRKIQGHFRTDSYVLYERLARLFRVIDVSDAELNVPRYNGGLFLSEPKEEDTSPEAEAARFLLSNRVADAPLALAIDRLARDEEGKGEKLIPIDYKSLGVRQLGSIYEGLLEFRLRVAREEMAIVKGKKAEEVVPLEDARKGKKAILKEGRGTDAKERILKPGTFYLENDKRERKATGSYYTPDFVVEYIVEKTVGPLLQEKLDALRPKLREAEQWHRKQKRAAEAKGEATAKYEFGPTVDRVWGWLVQRTFDLKVLDPAMGSGHFLVEAVDFITDEILDFLSQFPWNPVFSHLADLRKTILDDMERQGVSIDERKLTDVNLLKRHVLKRCIFGVDVNPMAVELAKVSLWLDCFTLGAPLSFLDHHLRCGNSILGVTVKEVEDAILLTLFGSRFDGLVEATERMVEVGFMPDVTSSQARESREAFQRASDALSPFKRHLDIYTTRWFSSSASKGRGKKGQGFTEIDFLKSSETQDFLSASSPKGEREALSALPTRDRAFAEAALEKAREMSFFHWEIGFPEVFYGFKPGTEELFVRLENGGFDAVVGNPPWVRQEGLKETKPALAAIFPDVYDAEADIYVYLLARGLETLRLGGRFGMILQNKWFKARYANALRKYLREMRVLEVVNFGHAPLFDADTFPCILLVEKTKRNEDLEQEGSVGFMEIDRKSIPGLDLFEYGGKARVSVPIQNLQSSGWELLHYGSGKLMEKIRDAGVQLRRHIAGGPRRGIITGLNRAFLISNDARERLVEEDPGCESVIAKTIRGENIHRWYAPWGGEWMILLKSSQSHDWPWSSLSNESEAEALFRSVYPSLHGWMKEFEDGLRVRQDRGRFWWELRACDYYDEFDAPKIIYQEIQFHSRFALDDSGLLSNNKVFFLPTDSLYTLSVLNSSLMWWYLFRFMGHQKDDALAMQAFRFEQIPIREPRGRWGGDLEELGNLLQTEAKKINEQVLLFHSHVFDLLGPGKLPASWDVYWTLDDEQFLLPLKRKSLSQSLLGQAVLLKEFRESRRILRELRRSACQSEIRLHHAVFDLYGLTAEEVRLVRETAPPRDPLTLAEEELALLECD